MKKILPLIIIILALGAYFYFNSQKNPQTISDSEAQLILFWGNGCPHCEKVKEYIKEKNLESKVKIVYKEVFSNQDNQKQLETTVQKCPEIDVSKGIGVPLAFDTQNNKCLYGDTAIIDWLNTK